MAHLRVLPAVPVDDDEPAEMRTYGDLFRSLANHHKAGGYGLGMRLADLAREHSNRPLPGVER